MKYEIEVNGLPPHVRPVRVDLLRFGDRYWGGDHVLVWEHSFPASRPHLIVQVRPQLPNELEGILKPGWVAKDEDGRWWWFEHKPTVNNNHTRWLSCSGDLVCLSRAAQVTWPECNWKESLIEIPVERWME